MDSSGFCKIGQKKIHGTIYLVDHDNYDDGNAQRYLGMPIDWIGKPKTEGLISRLKQTHPELNVIGRKMDMNSYFEQENRQCHVRLALCGLDSKYGRQQLAVKLPEKIINMWTDENRVGTTRFSFRRDQMCLYCMYPEQKEKARDEIGMLCNETGLKPSRIRELLDSGTGINEDEVLTIGRKNNIRLVAGTPITSVRGNCAPSSNSDQKGDETKLLFHCPLQAAWLEYLVLLRFFARLTTSKDPLARFKSQF